MSDTPISRREFLAVSAMSGVAVLTGCATPPNAPPGYGVIYLCSNKQARSTSETPRQIESAYRHHVGRMKRRS